MKHLILTSLLLSFAAGTLPAQVETPAPPISPADCAAAAQTLTTGALAAADSQVRARELASGCNDGTSIATAMARWKASTDTASLARIFSPAVADDAVANAAISVASDAGASTIARVLSINLLLARVYSSSPGNLRDISSTEPGDLCVVSSGLHDGADPRPLSSSVGPAARSAIAPLEGNGALPLSLRSAANCFMNAWRSVNGYPALPVGSFATAFSVHYVCRSQFQVRSTADIPVVIQYRVGSGPVKTLALVGRVSPNPDGVTDFNAGSGTATVSILLDGVVIGSVTGTNTSTCPP